jgi:hypothetical protein
LRYPARLVLYRGPRQEREKDHSSKKQENQQ